GGGQVPENHTSVRGSGEFLAVGVERHAPSEGVWSSEGMEPYLRKHLPDLHVRGVLECQGEPRPAGTEDNRPNCFGTWCRQGLEHIPFGHTPDFHLLRTDGDERPAVGAESHTDKCSGTISEGANFLPCPHVPYFHVRGDAAGEEPSLRAKGHPL